MRKIIAHILFLLVFASFVLPAQAAGVVDRWPVGEKLIAVTIEDVEKTEDLQQVLALCRRTDVKLTFFLQAAVITANSALVKQAVADGHVFGNHGLKHRYWGDAEKREIVEDLTAADTELRQVAGESGRLLIKPPYYYYETTFLEAAAQFSPQAAVVGGEDVADWLDVSPQAVLDKAGKLAENGKILNLNYKVKNGADALPALLAQLKAQGYRIVTLTELRERSVRKAPVQPLPVPMLPFDAAAYGVLDSLPTARPEIALTFDDGGRPESVKAILEQLRQNGAKATFFLLGGWVNENPGLVRRIAAEGHEIANHSYSHKDFSWLDTDTMQWEVNKTSENVQAVTGKACAPYFRPPYGSYNNRVVQTIKELGYAVVLWTIDTRDWTGASAERIFETVDSQAGSGAIVLFHLQGENTAEALSRLLPRLKAAGYSLLTISEILRN